MPAGQAPPTKGLLTSQNSTQSKNVFQHASVCVGGEEGHLTES